MKTDKDRYEYARKKAEETASVTFRKKPKEVEEAFQTETTMGSPENLIAPDDKNE